MNREVLFFLLLLPLPIAWAIDFLAGDPQWLYHPVRLVGKCISGFERQLRRRFPPTPAGERAAGNILAAVIPLLFFVVLALLLAVCWRLHPALWFVVETYFCYQMLAARSLYNESMRVYQCLTADRLAAARQAVGRIVGRDTQTLDMQGVVYAAVETVAENTSDGVIAPLLYMSIGGAPLALCYKAVNTLDSMVGYQNDKYLHLGRASARLDDAANYLPARFAANLMIIAANAAGFDKAAAKRIYLRDRRNHASPNSAHTEAVCAGALGLRLGGNASYSGVTKNKPTIGDDTRPPEPRDIPRANRLMLYTSAFGLIVSCFVRILIVLLIVM